MLCPSFLHIYPALSLSLYPLSLSLISPALVAFDIDRLERARNGQDERY